MALMRCPSPGDVVINRRSRPLYANSAYVARLALSAHCGPNVIGLVRRPFLYARGSAQQVRRPDTNSLALLGDVVSSWAGARVAASRVLWLGVSSCRIGIADGGAATAIKSRVRRIERWRT